uniref:C2H2-type domain-containing protein n=1 Tax=Meloidogyne floridensis TaxID=298350 RepID=A0A915PB53_9BILA
MNQNHSSSSSSSSNLTRTNNSTYYSNNNLNFNNLIEEERFLNFNNSLNNYEFNNKQKLFIKDHQIKNEEELNNLLLEQQQNNEFNQNLIDVNASSSVGNASSNDFFSPLHQLLMPSSHQQQQQHLHHPGEPSGSSSYFCCTDTSTSSAPADPRPSGSIAERRQHYKAPSNDRKRPYPCSLCSSRFGSKMELEEHQNSHTGQKPFQCDMQFKWKNSLKCHKEMHLRKNELQASSFPEVDATQMLTYATAAKKKMGELTGKDPSTITLLPTTSNNSSRFLTCAGTPRKRAPPKIQKNIKIPKTFEEEKILPTTSTSTTSFSLPFLPQPSSTSSQNSNFSHQFFGKEIKNNENQINNSEQILENNLLDLFRLHCGLNNQQNNSSSEQQQQQLLLLQQQQQNNSQQQFISPQHLQLISPTTTNNYSSSSSSNQQQQLIVQQNFPLDLLACCNNNGGNTSS